MKRKIMHRPVIEEAIFLDGSKKKVLRYACNRAVIPNPHKLALKESEVNCDNCIKKFVFEGRHYSKWTWFFLRLSIRLMRFNKK